MCILRCGSGIIINNYANWLNSSSKEQNYLLATDINFDACYLTKKFSDYYNVYINKLFFIIIKN